MSPCTKCNGTRVKSEVVPEYDAEILGAPFKVILKNSVKVETCRKCGVVLNTAIPNPEGLLYAVAFVRALHPRKLAGPEIKFMRNVMGWKSKKLAEELGITAEHMSRCENGSPMSAPTEKLFRLYSILTPGCGGEAMTPEGAAKAGETFKGVVDDLIEGMKKFKIAPTWPANSPLVFAFEHRRSTDIRGQDGEGADGKWKPEKKKEAA